MSMTLSSFGLDSAASVHLICEHKLLLQGPKFTSLLSETPEDEKQTHPGKITQITHWINKTESHRGEIVKLEKTAADFNVNVIKNKRIYNNVEQIQKMQLKNQI